MTMSECMKAAHVEARAIVATKRCSYREALMYGMRRVYAKLQQDRNVAIIMARPAAPQFMGLRGM